jgi:hypothetical protein
VAENRGDGGGDGKVEVARGEVELHEFDGEECLSEVEQKGGEAEAFCAGAQNVGRADVAAPDGADVLMPDEPDEEISEGNRAQQICERNGDEPGIHCLVFVISLEAGWASRDANPQANLARKLTARAGGRSHRSFDSAWCEIAPNFAQDDTLVVQRI